MMRIYFWSSAICILEFRFDSAWTLSAYIFASSTIFSLRRDISLRISMVPLLIASSTILPRSAFVYVVDGAFFKAWIVLASAVLTSGNPSLVSSVVEGALIPSRLLGWGENSTYLPLMKWFCFTYFLYTAAFKHWMLHDPTCFPFSNRKKMLITFSFPNSFFIPSSKAMVVLVLLSSLLLKPLHSS